MSDFQIEANTYKKEAKVEDQSPHHIDSSIKKPFQLTQNSNPLAEISFG